MSRSLLRCWVALRNAGFDAERCSDRLVVSVPGLESRLLGSFGEFPFFRIFDDRFVISRSDGRFRVTLDYWRPAQLVLHATAGVAVPLSLSGDPDPAAVLCWVAASQLAVIGATLAVARGAAIRIRSHLPRP